MAMLKRPFKEHLILLFSCNVALILSYLLALIIGIPLMEISFLLPSEALILFSAWGIIHLIWLLRKNKLKESKTDLYFTAAIFISLPIFWSIFRAWKQWYPSPAFDWDYFWAALDKYLFLGHHPWELFYFTYKYDWFLNLLDQLYLFWFLWLFTWISYFAWKGFKAVSVRFFTGLSLIWIIQGILVAKIFSSAGPCFWKELHLGDEYKTPTYALLKTPTLLHAYQNQSGLWQSYFEKSFSFFGGISAFPSLHVAIATFIALHAFEINKKLGFAAWIYTFFIWLGSIILLWHYAVDGLFAIICTTITYYLLKRWDKR